MTKIKLLLTFLFITLIVNSCKNNEKNEIPKEDCCVKEKCDTTYPHYDSTMKELIPFMLEGEFQDDTIGQGCINTTVIPYKPTKLCSNNKK